MALNFMRRKLPAYKPKPPDVLDVRPREGDGKVQGEPAPEVKRAESGQLLPGSGTPNPEGGAAPAAQAGRAISDGIKRMLEMNVFAFNSYRPLSVADTIAWQLVKQANEGDQKAIKDLVERIEGRPVQALEMKHLGVKDTDERISDITRSRLNALAAAAGASGGLPEEAALVEVSDDGAVGSQGSDGESPVAEQAG
jgi:hypothetical protein